MEKKPVRRDEHIVKLSREHHFSLLFCWKIRQGLKHGIATDRIQPYIPYFWQHHMQPHFIEEETILFAPLKDDKVQRAIDEHRQIEQLIKIITDTAKPTIEQLSSLADRVDNHIRYEERTLFPHLEEVLTPEQLSSIGKQLDAVAAEAKDDYADEFWMKKK
jgi:hemerythrin-like domain-containing protein